MISKVQHYVNVWLFNKNISLWFEGIYCGQHKLSYLGIENCIWVALFDVGELNFGKSFLHFNVKKKYPKVTVNLTENVEY